jgi:hypothetical protein
MPIPPIGPLSGRKALSRPVIVVRMWSFAFARCPACLRKVIGIALTAASFEDQV